MEDSKQPEQEPQPYPEGLDIDLDLALGYAKRWRHSKDLYAHEKLHGFHVSITDFEAMLGENATGVRLYLGLDDQNNAKIMFVGTILTTHADGSITFDDMLKDTKMSGKVYDFSMPCPRECSSVSPFNDIK